MTPLAMGIPKILLLASSMALGTVALGTDWYSVKVKDPISGKTTVVYDVASYGGYIYDWPSKYDGIFWPLIDEAYIRFNVRSGYIAFGSDFEEIDEQQKQRVREFLRTNYDRHSPPKSYLEKVLWLGRVYRERGASAQFFVKYQCLLCYLTRGEKEQNLQYRRDALKEIETFLSSAKPSVYSAHLKVVAGFYHSILGNAARAESYWKEAESADLGLADVAESQNSKSYLLRIIEEMKSGGYRAHYEGEG